MRIALDAMGGDQAPAVTVAGAVAAARNLGVAIALVGDRAVIGGNVWLLHDVAAGSVIMQPEAVVVG